MIYYSLFCLQNGDYMSTGKNSTSLDDLKSDLLEYVSVDFPSEKPTDNDPDHLQEWEDWQAIQRMPVNEIAEMWEFSIQNTPHTI